MVAAVRFLLSGGAREATELTVVALSRARVTIGRFDLTLGGQRREFFHC